MKIFLSAILWLIISLTVNFSYAQGIPTVEVVMEDTTTSKKAYSTIRTLTLAFKNLKTLPDSISQHQRLILLYLEHNQLFSLPKSIGKLQKLKALNLSSNTFRNFP